MARMSIDDKLSRDPRAIRLGRIYGWRRQEAIGRLLDVFALAYDRECDVLPDVDIDIAAEQEGFAESMVLVNLGEKTRSGIRIKGAAERIKYLQSREETGRVGGLKSAESRRKKSEGKSKVTFNPGSRSPSEESKETFAKVEGRLNPPDVVPDPVPDVVPDPVPDVVPVPERERPARASAPPPAPTPVAPPGQSAWHRRRVWWSLMLEADERIKASGIDPAAPSLPPAPAGENEKGIAACEKQLLDAGYDFATVDAKMRHIVLVAEAEAIRERHRKWFKPSLIWDPKRAARAADTPLEEASAQRDQSNQFQIQGIRKVPIL